MTFPPVVPSIASLYYCKLKDSTGQTTAIFDDWITLRVKRQINGICDYVFKFNGLDLRKELFHVNDRFEVYRSVPDCGLDYYREFEGLHETQRRSIESSGIRIFTSEGVGLNGLLPRRDIAYNAGTIGAEKSAPAETVMKEYVNENCGGGATVIGGRYFDCSGVTYEIPGNMSDFYIDTDQGRGITWEGTRAFNNLMDVLKDISEFALMDFQIVSYGDAGVLFKVYPDR